MSTMHCVHHCCVFKIEKASIEYAYIALLVIDIGIAKYRAKKSYAKPEARRLQSIIARHIVSSHELTTLNRMCNL